MVHKSYTSALSAVEKEIEAVREATRRLRAAIAILGHEQVTASLESGTRGRQKQLAQIVRGKRRGRRTRKQTLHLASPVEE